MGTTEQQSRTFASKLRGELDRQGLGVRTLAKRIDPANPERTRRSLNKWLAGEHRPSAASRLAVAEALGVPSEVFSEDDEEDASMPLSAVLFQRAIDAAFRERMTA